MKYIDYENLFVYMSLIFAFCIFIILLYGCAFANKGSQIYENFLNEDDKGDVKSQVLALLKDLETKDTTSAENKTKITDAIEKINNNNISVAELKTIIDLLKDMMQQQTKETSSKSPRKRPSITPSTATTDKEPTVPTKDATAAATAATATTAATPTTPTASTAATKEATAATAAA
jgi:TolA-binding protein